MNNPQKDPPNPVAAEIVYRIMDTLVEAAYRHAVKLGFSGNKEELLLNLQEEASGIVRETRGQLDDLLH